MIISTMYTVQGYRVRRVHGLVRGNTIRARHAGRDVMAFFRNLAGGEIHEYTKMLAESREQAIDRMVDEARAMGANAIMGVGFQTSMVMMGAAEMLCFGTAVTLEPEEAGGPAAKLG